MKNRAQKQHLIALGNVIYAPVFRKAIMFVVRNVPAAIFQKTSL